MSSDFVQVLPIQKMDAITAMLPVRDFPETSFLLMLTEGGSIKRTPLSLFKDPSLKGGLIAIKLKVRSCPQGGYSCDSSICSIMRVQSAHLHPSASGLRV